MPEADIVGHGSDDVADQIPADIDLSALSKAEEELAHLFRHTNRLHPAIIEIMRLAAIRKVQHVTV
ncbi:MAG: hypothetical protein PHI31_02095 [Desulfuromonadaceae bacterium]|nr:hypothetical protein [Desulfuromonadaceae bacterium]